MYLTILIVVHVIGAVVGIGSTYAFSILGPNVGKAGPNGGAAILASMIEIEKKIVSPVTLFTQPLTGVLIIFETGRNQDFFSHTWLWVAILIYAVIMVLSYGIDLPAMHRTLAWMKAASGPPTPEVEKDIKTANTLGPIMGILGVIIVILMVWKPGE